MMMMMSTAEPTLAAQIELPTPAMPIASPTPVLSPEVAEAAASIGALTVFADADESIGVFPLTVRLDVEVLPGTGLPPYRYHWDFGDGTRFSDERNPTHIYRIPGNFRASVVVIDARGELDQDYVDMSVSEPRASGAISARELRAWVLEQGQPDGASGLETDASHPDLVPGGQAPDASR